jgi:hypothetical protein
MGRKTSAILRNYARGCSLAAFHWTDPAVKWPNVSSLLKIKSLDQGPCRTNSQYIGQGTIQQVSPLIRASHAEPGPLRISIESIFLMHARGFASDVLRSPHNKNRAMKTSTKKAATSGVSCMALTSLGSSALGGLNRTSNSAR